VAGQDDGSVSAAEDGIVSPSPTVAPSTPTTLRDLFPPAPSPARCNELHSLCAQSPQQELASSQNPLTAFQGIVDQKQDMDDDDVLGTGDGQLRLFIGKTVSWRQAGDYELCEAIPHSHHCTISAFDIQVLNQDTNRGIAGTRIGPNLGECIPQQCTASDFSEYFLCQAPEVVLPPLSGLGQLQRALQPYVYGFFSTASDVFCAEDANYAVDWKAAVMLGVVGVLTALVVVATYLEYRATPVAPLPPDEDDVNARRGEDQLGDIVPTACTLNPRVALFVRTWSLSRNTAFIFQSRASSSSAADNFACLNGLRVFSNLWVVFFHGWIVHIFTASNLVPTGVASMSNTETYLIIGAFQCVDTFYVIGGFLAAYLMLRKFRKTSGSTGGEMTACSRVRQFVLIYAHRYMRLTPLYAFVIFCYICLVPYVGSGPFWVQLQESQAVSSCNRFWYLNLLYLNSVLPSDWVWDQTCMGWTWSLGNDFLFYLAVVPIVYLYTRRPRLAWAILALLLLQQTLVSGYISNRFELNTIPLAPDYELYLYGTPWTRAGPYVIGVMLALYYSEQRDATESTTTTNTAGGWFTLNNASMRWLGYALSVTVMGLSLFLSKHGYRDGAVFSVSPRAMHWQQEYKDVFNALSRPLWAAAVAYLSYASFRGYGGVFRWFFSLRFWEPLSHLTYGCFLWHNIVNIVSWSTRLTYPTWSYLDLFDSFVFVSLVSFGLSWWSFVLVERPIGLMESRFVRAAEARLVDQAKPPTHNDVAGIVDDPTATPNERASICMVLTGRNKGYSAV
jgi:peptidoglycan/LPS O-acetylase OafA/YrhL